MLNEDATAYTFGDQAGLETVIFLQDLFVDGCAKLEIDPYGDQTDFGSEKVLFTISSTSGLPFYRTAVEDGGDFNWSISTLPTDLDSPRVNIYGASLSILRTSPEKQLASWLFIKWLTEPEQTAHWSRATNYFPVRKSVALELGDYFEENPQYEKAFGFLSHDMAIEPAVASYQECRDAISEMLDAVIGGGDPASALTDSLDECNTLMEEIAPE